MRGKELLVIIPAYNEEENIGRVLDQLESLELSAFADVLVIDDASIDGTGWETRRRGVETVAHVFNLGYGESLQTGYHYAVRGGYRYVIQMDGDGQHDAGNVLPIYRRLKEPDRPDIVLGSRFMEGAGEYPVSLRKRLALQLFRLGIRGAAGRWIADPTTGLQGLSCRAFRFYARYNHFDDKYPDANMILQMLLLGFRVEEEPAVMHSRTAGKSMHRGLSPVWYMCRMLFSMLAVIFRIKVLKMDVGEAEDYV